MRKGYLPLSHVVLCSLEGKGTYDSCMISERFELVTVFNTVWAHR